MTATSSTRTQRRLRLSSMESLGFTESPLSHTDHYWQEIVEPVAMETTRLETRHEQAPTGDMVKDLWDSTELVAPSLVDWEPQKIDRKRLRSNFRWSRVALTLIIGTAVGVGAFWMTQRADETEAASINAVSARASELASALDEISGIGDQLSSESPLVQPTVALVGIDDAARRLFDVSATLPGSAATTRSIAADISSLSLDASRQIRDALAFRGAVETILVAPELETDPNLTDLADAALAFTEWRSMFDATRDALPQGVAVEVGEALDTLSRTLGTMQTSYVDAIRANDPANAALVVEGLESELTAIRLQLMVSMDGVATEVDAELDQAQDLISRLVG